MTMRRPLVAGNWKMNGLKGSVVEFGQMVQGYDGALKERVELVICPPFTLLATLAVVALGSRIVIGGQDCHTGVSGAHTGDVSAEMIADTGAGAVIVGHSERRTDHAETDATVRAKSEAAHRAGLVAIICVGETLAEREAERALAVVNDQLAKSVPEGATASNTVVAYEPVWAIGTGRTPTLADIAEMHDDMRRVLVERFGSEGEGMRLLYGGSVKPENAREILSTSNVDGALVGGASLTAASFLAIARSYI